MLGCLFRLVLQVEDGQNEAHTILEILCHNGEIVGPLWHDLSDHVSSLEPEHRIVLTRDRLHLGVFGETAHVEALNTAIARRPDDSAHQLGANAAILPWPLDRKGRLSFLAPESIKL